LCEERLQREGLEGKPVMARWTTSARAGGAVNTEETRKGSDITVLMAFSRSRPLERTRNQTSGIRKVGTSSVVYIEYRG